MGGSNTSHSNLKNAVLAFLVPLPSILFYLTFLYHYQDDDPNLLSPVWKWCYNHPILLANIFFFFNVNVLFWLIGLIQSSHWVNFCLAHFLSLELTFFFLFSFYCLWKF